MGKRQERRLAAMMGAGRRVKLDLFAEPSGDLGGSFAKDGVGKDVDAKVDTELPNSPSSSGQQAANPLSLLGQYSDDDLDEESDVIPSAPDGSLRGDDDQTKVSVAEAFEEGEIDCSEDLSLQKADTQDLESDSASPGALLVDAGGMNHIVASDEKRHEVNVDSLDPVPEPSATQTAGGLSSCWKMVLHEESNRYYYWNTVTGETSWEVPDALTQGTGLGNELQLLGTEMKENAPGDINVSSATSGVKSDDFSTRNSLGYTNGVLDVTAVYEAPNANQSVEKCNGDGKQLLGSSTVVGVLPCETSMIQSYSLCEQLNAGGSSIAGSHEVYGQSTMINEHGSVDHPSRLIKHAESLLEKLKLLQGSVGDQQGWILKYMLEVEIRLCDIKSLSTLGSSLGPFWLHSERRLTQLELTINSVIGEQNNKNNGMHLSSTDQKKLKVEDGGEESKVNTDMRKLSPESSCTILHDTEVSSVVQKTLHDRALDDRILGLQQVSAEGPSTLLHSEEKRNKEINGAASQGEASPVAELHSDEDVDMDVDMEVEEPSPAQCRTLDKGGQLITVSEQLIKADNPTAEQTLGPGSEFVIPPPPDEEWIPPPPPDTEGIPPPPPDDVPESCPPAPPIESELVQSIHNEQYNINYVGSNVHYYDNTSTDASGGSFYEHADGSQLAALTPAVYYAPVSTVQPTAVPSPAESAVYYSLQNGVMPMVPFESSVGPSGFQATIDIWSYDQLSSMQMATGEAFAETLPVSNQLIDPLVPGANTGTVASGLSSTSVVLASSTVSEKENVSAPSLSAAASSVMGTRTSANASDVSAPPAKAQSKATRVKKPKVTVASSLRYNKKVSSLVDKWKAAKEELQEEEEEHETALEILEKKRQREIEEWHAQQIASREAKENANFQPLGGDWRERVKRRRAQKETTVKTSSDTADDKIRQPDLSEFSRDLPLGWQAYWDDSSRQVYYANSITSETTWTRPTR